MHPKSETRRSDPHVERPYRRYESTSQQWWRDLRVAKRFPSAR